jgi:hypothetical protein
MADGCRLDTAISVDTAIRFHFTQTVLKVVLKKTTAPKIRQLIPHSDLFKE